MHSVRTSVTKLLIMFMFPLFVSTLAVDIGLAQNYSRHCRQSDSGGDVKLVEGTYEGTWEEALAISQTIEGHPLKQVFSANGTFKLKINNSSPSGSSIQGEMLTYTKMDTFMAGQRLAGRGSLTLDGDVGTKEFTAKANHTTSGNVYSPGYSQSQQFTDVVEIRFTADQADCSGASGKVRSQALLDIAKMSEASGYTIEWLPAKWQMTRVEDPSDKIAKLKEELNRKPPAGIVQRRESEGTRLGKIADGIKKEPKELQECLYAIWFEHVKKVFQEWVLQDTAKLRGYNGDYQGLQSLARQALEADRSLCLVGLDTCSENIHQDLWDALGGALTRYLKRMVDGQAPIENIMNALREGEILGVISPQLRERCWDEIRRQAQQEADMAWQEYKTAYKAAPGDEKAKAKNPSVISAINKAVTAEKAAAVCGVELNRAVQEALRLEAAAHGQAG